LTQELSELGGAFIDLNVEDCGHFALVEYLTLPLLANLVQSFQELVSMRMTPLLTMDVWEHAYYLDDQNARAKYAETFVDTTSISSWLLPSKELTLTSPSTRMKRTVKTIIVAVFLTPQLQ
jgi:hypothetical protein